MMKYCPDTALVRQLRAGLRQVQEMKIRTPAEGAGLHEQVGRLTAALADLDTEQHPGLPLVRERLRAWTHERGQGSEAERHACLVSVLQTTLRQLR
ncbi:hypothetical protein I2I05_20230 [Hymenobacter sp. BT683]|uniref:Uncharacterized protein n=1 Tax=Hymenobacter jeongseonensis TaxID=2791027 RepID=A0ABS0IMY5_9BACT|nr:hypothetical protein [Hymenobacter jeongseonensis]MBF9239732.1 hypothetical protein [Hymenobacter jeongseonensis]